MIGNFYVLATPIGNMEDITIRGKRILSEVDYIATEDTRQAGSLLKLLDIPRKELLSYRDQNHIKTFPKILNLLQTGSNIALISDRGTPTISDPGFKLVRDLQEEGIQAITIPGVSAVIAALSISGLPTDSFSFLGFLPKKSGKATKELQKYSDLETTVIIYESPNRLIKTLEIIQTVYPQADTAIVKELTKMNENVYRGNAKELIEKLSKVSNKGEWVILFSTK